MLFGTMYFRQPNTYDGIFLPYSIVPCEVFNCIILEMARFPLFAGFFVVCLEFLVFEYTFQTKYEEVRIKVKFNVFFELFAFFQSKNFATVLLMLKFS